MRICTKLENGILRNGQQLGSAVNNLGWGHCKSQETEFIYIYTAKEINHRVVTLVAKEQWLCIVYFANCTRQPSAPCLLIMNHSVKQISCFNHRVVGLPRLQKNSGYVLCILLIA